MNRNFRYNGNQSTMANYPPQNRNLPTLQNFEFKAEFSRSSWHCSLAKPIARFP